MKKTGEFKYQHPAKLKSLSLVLPAYNEEENIGHVIEDAYKAASAVTDLFEIIVVNDGSGDNTVKVVEDYAKDEKYHIKLLNNPRNQGYGPTVKNGLLAAKYEWVFFTDADRQFDLSEITKLIPYTDRYEFVVGKRVDRQDEFGRILNAKIFNIAVRAVFGIKIKDIDCAYKLMKRSSLHSLELISESAMINTEIIHKASRAGLKIKEVAVTHLPRLHGEATGANPGVIKKAITEFFTLRWQLLHNEKALMKMNTRLVVLLSSIAVIGTLIWAYNTGVILAFGDAEAHLNIAKRVVSGLTPGAAQIGGIWLPLPHLLMLPFVANDWLWRSGIGGAIPSMVAFIFLCAISYKFTYLITKSFLASYILPLVIIFNPNSLYMAVTPMSEILMLATFTASVYFFYKWIVRQEISDLIIASFFTLLATLSRYDGWALACIEMAVLVVFLIVKKVPYKKIEGISVIFGYLAFLGILFWLIWNAVIFHNPLYFSDSVYGSKSQQMFFLAQGYLPTYHNLAKSIQFFAEDTHLIAGLPIIIASVLGLLFLLYKTIRLRKVEYAALIILLLTPFLFYVVSLYSGQASLILPTLAKAGAVYTISNVRYGIQMLLAIGVFMAILATRYKVLLPVFVVLLIGTSAWMVTENKVISYQDGTGGLSSQRISKGPDAPAVEEYLRDHYDGGLVLMDDYRRPVGLVESGIPMNAFIGSGSKPYWSESFDDPGKYAKWLVVQKSSTDAVWTGIKRKDLIQSEFVPVFNQGNLYVYEKKAVTPKYVVRKGQHLYLGNDRYQIRGVNSYDLLQQSDTVIANRMGVYGALKYNTIRLWCFNKQGGMTSSDYKALNYVLQQAQQYDLRILCVLGNTYNDYGGPSFFGASTLSDFFTSERSIAAYKQEIRNVLYHKDSDGRKFYKNSRILGWELINEPRVEGQEGSAAVSSWVKSMGEYVLSIDNAHLLSPGTEGFTSSYPGQYYNENHGSSVEDICALEVVSLCSGHLYPKYISSNGSETGLDFGSISNVLNAWRTIGNKTDKPFFIGEVGYDYQGSGYSSEARQNYFNAVKEQLYRSDLDGGLLWNAGDNDDDHFTLNSSDANRILRNW